MDKIRVLHALSYSHYPERFYNLLKEMEKYFDIYVLYVDYASFKALSRYMPSRVFWIPSLNVVPFLSLKNYYFSSISKVVELLKIINPDIIHIHTHYFLSNYQIARVARRLKIPTILDIQGIIENKNLLIDTLQYIYLRSSLLRSLLYEVDGIRFVSVYDFMYMKTLCNVIHTKSMIIPNFIELDKYYIGKKIPHTIIWHGRLVRKKRLDFILRSVAILLQEYGFSDLIFYLIGYGPEFSRLIRLAQKYKISNNIVYKPFLKTQGIINLLSKCEVIPYTSTYEGNPYSLLEAAACGVYPIGFKTPGTYETIRLLGGRIIEDADVLKLASTIADIFSKGFNPWVFRERVKKYYSPQVVLPKLKEFYQNIITYAKSNN
jgi:glycosyltransferase involved in cell wall biosynthesis